MLLKRLLVLVFFLMSFHTSVYGISAQSAILIDGHNGRILYEKNAYQKRGMASTTKIMTGILAIENCDPNYIAEVSYNAANTEGSSMYLNSGEKIRMESLIYGLMLNSGNDAATAIAENISGSVEKFALLMNKKAAEIGMKDTSFANPHGLDNEMHYSTAYDMALLGKYAMKNEKFRNIVSSKRKNVELNGVENSRYLTNHNKLLSYYPYCVGIKTGFTKACGRCLVSAAEKDGVLLIAVTLNASDDWNDHISMYNNVFDSYKSYKILEKNSYIASVKLINGKDNTLKLYSQDDLSISLTDEEYNNIKIKYNYPDTIEAPVYKGQIIGSAEIILNNKTLAQTNLISQYGMEKNTKTNYTDNLYYLFNNLFSLFFKSV